MTTFEGLEPGAQALAAQIENTGNDVDMAGALVLVSAVISLKRIADALEQMAKPEGSARPLDTSQHADQRVAENGN